MRRPSTIRRAAGVLVFATMAVGCAGSDTVATVDGVTIAAERLEAMRTSYGDAAVLPGGQLRDDLSLMIFTEALTAAAEEEFGITISDDDIRERIANPPPRWQPNIEGLAASSEFGPERLDIEARLTLVRDRVIGPAVLEEFGSLDAYVTAAPQEVTLVCVRHLLLASEVEAQEALDRLAAGEDFEALAAEVSLAPSPDLTPPEACPLAVGPLGEEFSLAVAEAPLGEAIGPMQTDFGHHVVIVDERTIPDNEAAFLADATAFMDPDVVGAVFTQWFNDAVRDADISVASNIGSWSPDGLGIAAPGS